ncbi:hypothetical protein JCM10207_006629 [Rhodosporidiobolus poonsookiae]
MAPRGPPTLSSTTASTTTPPFPPLTRQQHSHLQSILDHCTPTDHSWAHLSRARSRAHLTPHPERVRDRDGDDDLYPLLLQLTLQPGVTWIDKWRAALDSLVTQHHRTRPSDGLDLVRHKLSSLNLASSSSSPSPALPPPRRPPSTPALNHPTPSTASHPQPQPRPRPRSTPPTSRPSPPDPVSSSSTPVARPLLVRAEPGYSSSDDYVGVPRASTAGPRVGAGGGAAGESAVKEGALARAAAERSRARRRARDGEEHEHAQAPPRPRPGGKATPTPTPHTTAAPADSSAARHPLLARRLAELSTSAPPPTAPSAPPHRAPSPAPSSPSASSLPFLISGQFSPPEAHALALSFDRLRTLGGAWDTWRGLYGFLRGREKELGERRGTWMKRCVLGEWQARVGRLREAEARADAWAGAPERGKARKRDALRAWRARLGERMQERRDERRRAEREEREAQLRGARDEVVRRRNRRVGKQVVEHWYTLTLTRRAATQHTSHLLRTAFSTWHLRLCSLRTHRATLQSAAAERWATSERGRAHAALRRWGRKAALRRAERAVVRRRERGAREQAWDVWRDRAAERAYVRELERTAEGKWEETVARRAWGRWSARKAHVDSLTALSSRHSHTLALSRTRAALTHWRLHTRLSLSLRASSLLTRARALDVWLDRAERVWVDLGGRAQAVLDARDGRAVRATWGGWRTALARRRAAETTAAEMDQRAVLARTLTRWRAAARAQEVERRKADVVRAFMAQRAAWRVWFERAWEVKRARWVEEKRRERRGEALRFWIAQTRQKQHDRALVAQVQERSSQRLLASTLDKWKTRVILRRELEADAAELYERRVLQAGFKRWADQTVRAAERLVFADEHRALKLEELRDRSFHTWLSSARRSVSLKSRLGAFEAAHEARVREDAWGVWRERGLWRVERAFAEAREGRLRRAGMERWMARSKTLAATRFHTAHLLARAFTTWRAWTTPPELAAQAAQQRSERVRRWAVRWWNRKAAVRGELAELSLSRPFGPSPSSSTPSASVSARRSSLGLSRPSSPSAFSLGTPSPLDRAGVHRPRSAGPSSSTSPSASLSPSTAPTSFLASHAPSSTRRRPSLTAEYTAPSPPARSASRAGTESRTRSRSISSLRSVRTARSAPAGAYGGGAVDTDEDDEDDDEEEEEEDVPSPAFARLRALSTSTSFSGSPSPFASSGRRSTLSAAPSASAVREGKRAARSDGGSDLGGEGGRDVRGDYEALRRRLKEAAVRAKEGGGQ